MNEHGHIIIVFKICLCNCFDGKMLGFYFIFCLADFIFEPLMKQQHEALIKAPPRYCATAKWL